MPRLLVSALVWLGSATIGLLAAKWLLDGMTIDGGSFVVVVLIFAVLQVVLTPFLIKVTHRNAPALLSGVGLLSTFLALLITTVLSSGMSISGLDTWLFATLIGVDRDDARHVPVADAPREEGGQAPERVRRRLTDAIVTMPRSRRPPTP